MRLVFNHINKCAGTSLLYFLNNIFDLNHCLHMEKFADYANFLMPDFNCVSNSRFIHEPTSEYRNWKKEISNVTSFMVFRDPVDRLYSEWKMICAWSSDEILRRPQNKIIHSIAKSGFKNFVTSSDSNIVAVKNLLTRSLVLGDIDLYNDIIIAFDNEKSDSLLFPKAFELAVQNLNNIDIIGLSEYFEKTLIALCIALKISVPTHIQEHNSRGRESARDLLDLDTLNLAESFLKYDLKLYELVKIKFDSQMSFLYDQFGVDLITAANIRYFNSIEHPPDWQLITHNQSLLTHGWHSREINGSKLSRWTGPLNNSLLHIRINKSNELLIRARCTGFIDPKQLEAFSIRVDGVLLSTYSFIHLGAFRYFEASIISDKLNHNSNILIIEFILDLLLPSGKINDPRLLGLEFCEIEVGPLSCFIKGAVGTPKRSDYYVFN